MDNYTKYVVLSHLHWIDNAIIQEKLLNGIRDVKSKNPFLCINFEHLEQYFGYSIDLNEVITNHKLSKIKFLWLQHSKSSIDLDFVSHCTNLEDINFDSLSVTNLDFIKHNRTLKKIVATNNCISDIKIISQFKDLEYLNIENNPCLSLKPIEDLIKIKQITCTEIVEDNPVYSLLKNNKNLTVNYLIKGEELDFDKLLFPLYRISVVKTNANIDIEIEGLKDLENLYYSLKYPKEIQEKKEFDQFQKEKSEEHISNWLEKYLGYKPKINRNQLYYCNELYLLNYSHNENNS
jgi:hypothetical protein